MTLHAPLVEEHCIISPPVTTDYEVFKISNLLSIIVFEAITNNSVLLYTYSLICTSYCNVNKMPGAIQI